MYALSGFEANICADVAPLTSREMHKLQKYGQMRRSLATVNTYILGKAALYLRTLS